MSPTIAAHTIRRTRESVTPYERTSRAERFLSRQNARSEPSRPSRTPPTPPSTAASTSSPLSQIKRLPGQIGDEVAVPSEEDLRPTKAFGRTRSTNKTTATTTAVVGSFPVVERQVAVLPKRRVNQIGSLPSPPASTSSALSPAVPVLRRSTRVIPKKASTTTTSSKTTRSSSKKPSTQVSKARGRKRALSVDSNHSPSRSPSPVPNKRRCIANLPSRRSSTSTDDTASDFDEDSSEQEQEYETAASSDTEEDSSSTQLVASGSGSRSNNSTSISTSNRNRNGVGAFSRLYLGGHTLHITGAGNDVMRAFSKMAMSKLMGKPGAMKRLTKVAKQVPNGSTVHRSQFRIIDIPFSSSNIPSSSRTRSANAAAPPTSTALVKSTSRSRR